ncbi:MAG: hypothetical protein ACJA2S_004390 [Cyclobacteriaceae bacterium]|jgi:hypothetical protein
MWTQLRIKDWKHFIDFIEAIEHHKSPLPFWNFRGQANSTWDLLPSISRIFKDYPVDLKKALGIELNMYREFLMSRKLYGSFAPDDITEYKNIAQFMEMQHYSCPTRVLDWSHSPYVALYFAIDNELKHDGKIYGFHNSNLNQMNKKYFEDLSEDLILENRGEPTVYPLMLARHNERTLSQQGVFTISNDIFADHYQLISNALSKENLKENAVEMTIPKELKIEFMARLRNMNINGLTLFPGLDGLGKSLHKLATIRAATNT